MSTSLTPVACLVAIMFAACEKATDTSHVASTPGVSYLASLDLAAPDTDIATVSSIVGDAKIVALGESIHTNGSYHQANARLARYLIEKEKFREIALETPWQWAASLSEYTRTCSPSADPTEGLRRIFPQFASAELSQLYQWIRAFNCSHPTD